MAALESSGDGISLPEAARRLGVSPQTVHNWVSAGKLPATRFGPPAVGLLRIDPVDIEGLAPHGLTVTEAAERLGVPVQTVRYWIRSGRLPVMRFGPPGAQHIIRVDPSIIHERPGTSGH